MKLETYNFIELSVLGAVMVFSFILVGVGLALLMFEPFSEVFVFIIIAALIVGISSSISFFEKYSNKAFQEGYIQGRDSKCPNNNE